MNNVYSIFNFFNLFDDIFEKEKTNSNESIDEEVENMDQINLFKIPKYLEKCIIVGIMIYINCIIYHLVILPIKLILMLIKSITNLNVNLNKLVIYILKILFLMLGVYFKKTLEKSFPIFLMHHKLRSLSGMKIFTFMRITEFLNILLNSFNMDYDLQLVSFIKQIKYKKKIISLFILIISLGLNLVTFWSYMICLSIALNDNNNFIYPIFLKLSYNDIKKSGKPKKKKKLIEIITGENRHIR